MELKTVTYKEFLKFNPCWLMDDNGTERLRRYAEKLNGEATALDVLRLTRVPIDDRLWAVLREEFIDAAILHEFACRCAERALSRVENPDPRSAAAIAAKRAWVLGEISNAELETAENAAFSAFLTEDAVVGAATYAAIYAARAATYAARVAAYAAAHAADSAAYAATRAAYAAAHTATYAAEDAARAAEGQWQIEELTKILTTEQS